MEQSILLTIITKFKGTMQHKNIYYYIFFSVYILNKNIHLNNIYNIYVCNNCINNDECLSKSIKNKVFQQHGHAGKTRVEKLC